MEQWHCRAVEDMAGFLITGTRTTGYPVGGTLNLTAHNHKINLRRAVDLNIKSKIIKLLENRKKI